MVPIYVKSLFVLLRETGARQQDVAKTLGVSKVLVSLWANGKIPLPRQHFDAFLTLVAAALPSDNLSLPLQAYLGDWLTEIEASLEKCMQDFQASVETLGHYRTQDLRQCSALELEEISTAARTILRATRQRKTLMDNALPHVVHVLEDIVAGI